MTVLVLESDPSTRAWLEAGIRARGLEVVACSDAGTAWEAFGREHPALAILDWTGVEGSRLCHRIRAAPGGDRCVIVAAGLSDRSSDVHGALEAGADDYIAKPSDAGTLDARLAVAQRRAWQTAERARARDHSDDASTAAEGAVVAGAATGAPPTGRRAGRGLRVVCLGGGTGLPVVLQGLKETLFPPEWRRVPVRGRDQLTAIVTVADDGGSSGRLRRAYSILAPGDVRNCLLALADGDGSLDPLFRFRFGGDGDVAGHSLGNLILTALNEVEGDFVRAVERAGEILAARGRVYPSTARDVTLVAELEDGSRVTGESKIAAARASIRRLRLQPDDAEAVAPARDALRAADVVVIGPGSLYTSLLPNLLVRGIVEAIRESQARVVVVMNLMTEPGETQGYTASAHLWAVRRHVPGLPIHDVLVNAAPIGEARLGRYAVKGAAPVVADGQALRELGCRVVARELLADGPKIRHDARRVAEAVLDLATVRQGLTA